LTGLVAADVGAIAELRQCLRALGAQHAHELVNTRGGDTPLSQFATFTEEQESPLIWRRDRVPTLTVRADLTAARFPCALRAAVLFAYDRSGVVAVWSKAAGRPLADQLQRPPGTF